MPNDEIQKVVVKSEGEVQGYAIGYALGPPILVSLLVAAIAYKIFGTSVAGWIGAGIGFSATMLVKDIRDAFLSMMLTIVFGALGIAVLLGVVYFIFDTFAN